MAENSLDRNEKDLMFLTPKMCNKMAWIFQQPDVKKCIIQSIISNIMKVIELTRRVLMEDDLYRPNFSNRIFLWSIQHFAKRMDPNIGYVDVLQFESPKSVHITKFLTDLYCLEEYLKMIANNDIKETIVDLEGCLDLLHIRSNLLRDFRLNKALASTLEYKVTSFGVLEKSIIRTEDCKMYEAMDKYVDESLVTDPMYQRHFRNTLLTSFDMSTHKANSKMLNVEKTFRNCLLNIDKCNFSNRHAVRRYHQQIKDFRNKIEYWSWKYDTELEKVDNEISYHMMSIEALKKQKQDYEETITLYREEIQRTIEEEAQEKQRIADARAQKQLMELQKLNLKHKSKKGTPKKRNN